LAIELWSIDVLCVLLQDEARFNLYILCHSNDQLYQWGW
jgi:hypothetical protein